MARRGFAIIFTLLGAAFAVSIAGFIALYLLVGREPAVPSQLGADAQARRRPRRGRAGRRRRLPARRPAADGARHRRQPAQGQGRSSASAPCCSSRPASPRRSGARCRRCATRCSTSRSRASRLRLPRIRRRSRLLPGQRRRQGVPDAVEPARSHRRRHLRAVPARHARQDRRLSRTSTTSATTRPPSTPSPRRATRRRTGRWTSLEPRPLRAARARHRRGAQEDRGRGPRA